MKLLDIISEANEFEEPVLTDKDIDKLKKVRAALKDGMIQYKNGNTFLYELSSDYTPKWDPYWGKIALYYEPHKEPYGIKIYWLDGDKKIPLTDHLPHCDRNALFYGGRWVDATQKAHTIESVLHEIQKRLRAFDVVIYGRR